MTWTKLIPSCGTRNNGLTVRITKAGYDHPHLVIRMARTLAETAGIPPHETSRVDVLLGTGGDAGSMRLKLADNGAWACHPQGKGAALKVALMRPEGFPDDYDTTDVAVVISRGALTFGLPWHKRAADRQVEDDDDLPDAEMIAADVSGIFSRPPPPPSEAGAATTPPTLDAVEESARPVPEPAKPPTFHVEQQTADKPLNGTAKTHIYPDSFDTQNRIVFSHGGKTCEVNKRQHKLLHKLHEAMVKNPDGFLDDGLLVAVTGVPNAEALAALVSTVRKPIGRIQLVINRWPKLGYFMREAADG